MICWFSSMFLNHHRIPHTVSSYRTWYIVFREVSIEVEGIKSVGLERTESQQTELR